MTHDSRAMPVPYHRSYAAVLGLDQWEADPVRIILAAQLRLRRCRRDGWGMRRGAEGSEVRQIVVARDALLQRAVAKLARRGLRSLGGTHVRGYNP